MSQDLVKSFVEAEKAKLKPSPQPEQTTLPPEAYQPASVLDFVKPYVRPMLEIGGEMGAGIAAGSQAAKYAPKNPAAQALAFAGGSALGFMSADVTADMVMGEETDIIDVLQKGAMVGAFSLMGDAAGTLVSKGIGAISKRRAGQNLSQTELKELDSLNNMLKDSGVRLVTEGDSTVVKFFKEGDEIPENSYPITISPGQLTQSAGRKGIEKILKASFQNQATMDAFYEAQGLALRRVLEQEVMQIGSRNVTDFGKALNQSMERLTAETKVALEPAFKELEMQAKQLKFDFSPMKDYAANQLVDASKNFTSSYMKDGKTMRYRYVDKKTGKIKYQQLSQAETDLISEVDSVLKGIVRRRDNITFDSARADSHSERPD